MSNVSEDLKRVFLAGLGAVAKSSEKAKDLLEELIEKGAITLEQGKTINEELKHNLHRHNLPYFNICWAKLF